MRDQHLHRLFVIGDNHDVMNVIPGERVRRGGLDVALVPVDLLPAPDHAQAEHGGDAGQQEAKGRIKRDGRAKTSSARGKATAPMTESSSAIQVRQPGMPSSTRSGMAGGGVPAQIDCPTPSCTLLRRPPLD